MSALATNDSALVQLFGGADDGATAVVHLHNGALPDSIRHNGQTYYADCTVPIPGTRNAHAPRYSLGALRGKFPVRKGGA